MSISFHKPITPLFLAALLLPLAAAPQHDSPQYVSADVPQTLAGIRRLWVRAHILDPDLPAPGLTTKTLQAAVERQLRQAGVLVVTAEAAKDHLEIPLLEVDILSNNDVDDWYGYNVCVKLREGVTLARNPRRGIVGAVTWEYNDVGMFAGDELPQLKRVVSDLVTRFLRDYQPTHPGIKIPKEINPDT